MNDKSKAIEVLKSGGIVIFPTDTAYGIGCRIDREESIRRLFEVKKRSQNKRMLVLVDSIEMAKIYLDSIRPEVLKLMKKYWPGSLTIIYKCKKERVPEILRAGGNSLAVRLPDHEIVDIIKKVGVPILAPSANISGEKTPFKLEDIPQEVATKVDFILTGKCKMNKVSTIIDCTTSPFKIIREGAVHVGD